MKRILFLLLFSAIFIGIIYFNNLPDKPKELPVINPIDVNKEMVDPELLRLGYGHRIAHFTLTDQDSNLFSDKSLENKIYVAEYFFTTCRTICPIMNSQMTRIHQAFSKENNVHLLSFTVDPEHDTPSVLKLYADKHGAKNAKWHFLTGSKKELYSLARKSFFVLKPAEAVNQGDVGSDFIHTNNFVLVDKQRRIRGYYDGTSVEEVNRLIEDIGILLEER
ncbi:MAG: SCO family protein [Cryomorphaceae bacterium]|jgi:protein SCO1/2|nr:SCO family protein [Cryomorphaceae bacterium]